jgi:hypothetical protein
MIWIAVFVGLVLIAAIAVFAVSRVSVELEGTIAPALLEVDDAVEVVAESLPFEVSAVVSHDDVRQVVDWVLDWFDELGMVSDFGEELGGEWIREERAVADEIGAVDYAVARAIDEDTDIDSLHVTVIVDSFVRYLRDIGAVGDEVR